MQRPNMIGNVLRWDINKVTWKTMTNTIIDAIDRPVSDTNDYLHAQSATVPTEFSAENWGVNDATTTLNAGMKAGFGCFINGNAAQGNVLYQCNGVVSFYGGINCGIRFLFGQTIASSVTASDVAAANDTIDTIMMPMKSVVSDTNWKCCCVENDIIKVSTTITNPFVFGVVIENAGAVDVPLDGLHITLMVRAYIDEIELFNPVRQ